MGPDKAFQNIRWALIMVAMATVTAADPLFTCDFETDDLCGMEQWDNDDFDWTRNNGTTESGGNQKTGPRGAQVGTYYIYIETSDPNSYMKRAYISTPAIRHSGDICVRFYYSMYGDDIGRLVVFTEQQSESNAVWRQEGDKGGPWFDGKVTVENFTENDKVVFLGRSENGHLGDIALDYLRIHAGECSACQVDKGGCDTLCVKLAEPPYSRCECHNGYHIESDNPYKCVDIDECSHTNCSHTCQNTPGSYECQCADGYSLGPDKRVCQDIDECREGNSGCSDTCHNMPGSYECQCPNGYSLATDNRTCDIDECREDNGGCSDQCLNTVGSYHCQCPTGYSLAADNRTCEDIDECATDAGNECDHVCTNVEGSHNCSCRDTYIRATDGHHCIECHYAYKPKIKSSQLFTSECPTTASHTDITLADCLQEACRSQTGVVAYFNMVCDLKQCDRGNLRLKIVSGSSGWDIYTLNATWSAAPNDVNQGNPRSGDDFPLVPVVVGVLVPVILLVAIVIVVVLLRRRRQIREGSHSVHYENDPGRNITDREHDKTSPPITEVHSSAGIYEEVAEPDNKQQVPRNETYDDVTGDPVSRIPQVKEAAPNDASEGNTYKNAAFQGDCRYQGLGPDGNPRHYDTIE